MNEKLPIKFESSFFMHAGLRNPVFGTNGQASLDSATMSLLRRYAPALAADTIAVKASDDCIAATAPLSSGSPSLQEPLDSGS